jgi:hypothetical protein
MNRQKLVVVGSRARCLQTVADDTKRRPISGFMWRYLPSRSNCCFSTCHDAGGKPNQIRTVRTRAWYFKLPARTPVTLLNSNCSDEEKGAAKENTA